jgi:hypothetical protein
MDQVAFVTPLLAGPGLGCCSFLSVRLAGCVVFFAEKRFQDFGKEEELCHEVGGVRRERCQ